MTTQPERRSSRAIVIAILVIYVVGLALVLFWPEHIDRSAVGLLRRAAQVFPWATHSRIEFVSNVVLFLPLGFLLAVLMSGRRYLVLPTALVATVVAEAVQSLLPDRTTSLRDVVANATGACIGMLVAEIVARRHPQDAATRTSRP